MAYCPACGQELAEGASYCQKCGAALKGRTGAMEATEAPAPGLPPDPKAFRHPKERLFFTLGAVISGLAWIFLIWAAWPALLVLAFVFWLVGLYVKAFLYGNAVCLSEEQFRQVHAVVRRMGEELRLAELPEVFVLSGQGTLNALAMRFFSGRYILLYGELVDLMLRRGALIELRMIIGHELAHHVLGHISFWKRILLAPAFFLPFFGAAYSRACELSADRVGMILSRDASAARRALLSLALGSETLAAQVAPDVFAAQENRVPKLIGFLAELFTTHPRMTKRIIALGSFARERAAWLPDVGAGLEM